MAPANGRRGAAPTVDGTTHRRIGLYRSPNKVFGLRVGGAESVFGRDGKRYWESYLGSTR